MLLILHFMQKYSMVFTDCEPIGARGWMPCWDQPSDKATFELSAKVPNDVYLGSNGSLMNSIVSGDTICYKWKSHDPMATYLMCFLSKRDYKLKIGYWKRPSNANDSIPIRFYYQANEDTSYVFPQMKMIKTTLSYFSKILGEYPFEKLGFATMNKDFKWGGMENQSMIALQQNIWAPSMMIHELAHHWFGDLITPKTWNDIFLNEGFATYFTAVMLGQLANNRKAYINELVNQANGFLSDKSKVLPKSIPIVDSTRKMNMISFNDSIFCETNIYNKGACVLHNLRGLIGDSLFFKAIKEYTTEPLFVQKNATVSQFIAHFNHSVNMDLNWYFNQWLYQPGYPEYEISWFAKQIADTVNQLTVQVSQTQQNGVIYKLPIEFKIMLNSPMKTDTVKVQNDSLVQTYQFKFKNKITTVTFDPNTCILPKSVTIKKTTDIENFSSANDLINISPNPTNNLTKINFTLSEQTMVNLEIADFAGRNVTSLANETLSKGNYTYYFNTEIFPAGVYFCQFKTANSFIVKKIVVEK